MWVCKTDLNIVYCVYRLYVNVKHEKGLSKNMKVKHNIVNSVKLVA